MLKYLARYVSGVAISDKRLVSHAEGRVIFRWKNYRRGGRPDMTSLPGVEFVARYMQHVLPRGFVRIRYYGLLSNGHRAKQLARCRTLLGVSTEGAATDAVAKGPDSPDAKGSARTDAAVCPSCKRGRLVLVETWPRINGWPWASRPSQSKAAERPIPNSIEEFLARARTAPSPKRPSATLRRDTS